MTARDRSTSPPTTRRERRAQARAQRAGERRRQRPARRAPWRSPFALVSVAAVGFVAVLLIAANAGIRHVPAGFDDVVVPVRPVPSGLPDGRALGRADAPVVLEVYSDYQCPVCGRFAREYVPRLIEDFVVDGRLRVVDHPIAILGTGDPDESVDAAAAAVCAGRQESYWAYHDLLMANQHGENEGAFSRDRLGRFADALPLDRAAWDACFADPSTAAEVRSGTAGAMAAGIYSTPTFVLNGQRIVGLVPYEALATAIGAVAGSVVP